MRNIEWHQESVLALITNNVEETINLEFKSSDAIAQTDLKKKEISKDVSAFANSDGGVIVYGLKEINHVASELSFIDGNAFTKEWLEHAIQNNIQRRIENLRIIPVRFDNDISKTVYVIEIPRSYNAPHISKDKRYYKRYNFESVPMEEYEIRDIYSRVQTTKLVTAEALHRYSKPESWKTDNRIEAEICITIKNVGRFVANSYKVMCKFDQISRLSIIYDKSALYNVTQTTDVFSVSTTSIIPLFPDEHLTVLRFNIVIDADILISLSNNAKYTISIFDSDKIVESEVNLYNIFIDWYNVIFEYSVDNLSLRNHLVTFADED